MNNKLKQTVLEVMHSLFEKGIASIEQVNVIIDYFEHQEEKELEEKEEKIIIDELSNFDDFIKKMKKKS